MQIISNLEQLEKITGMRVDPEFVKQIAISNQIKLPKNDEVV
jgi:hypothetical protein